MFNSTSKLDLFRFRRQAHALSETASTIFYHLADVKTAYLTDFLRAERIDLLMTYLSDVFPSLFIISQGQIAIHSPTLLQVLLQSVLNVSGRMIGRVRTRAQLLDDLLVELTRRRPICCASS